MIALWMLHATALATLLGAAAALLEWALRMCGRPVRAVWAAALALALLLPVARLLPSPAAPAPKVLAGTRTLDPTALLAAGERVPARALDLLLGAEEVAAPAAWRVLDGPLAIGWGAITLLLALHLLRTARRTAARVRRWPAEAVDGLTIRVAPDLGPAVFGAVRATVIVPRWALADDGLPLMLAHETAHVRARDPLLLSAGLLAAVLMPWNAPAWWLLRRLRLAVELDCDARVLARAGGRPDAVRRYGALLLDVARRATGAGAAPALLSPTLLATPSTLSRRIHAMTAPRPRRALTRALPATVAAALLVAAACEMPRPTAPKAEPRAPLARITESSAAAPAGAAAAVDRQIAVAEMRRLLEQAYPATLREASGRTQRLWFVQEGSGRVSRVLRGTAPANAAADMRMENASLMVERDGKYVGAPITDADAAGAAGIEADEIATVDVYKLAPGVVGPDSVQAIWMRLKGDDERPVATADRLGPTTRARVRMKAGDSTASLQRLDAGGAPIGGPSTIRLRTARDSSAPRPLYLVDGQEVDGSPASLPKPDRIEGIDVLKGAAATALYGERATNGVVVIRTKP